MSEKLQTRAREFLAKPPPKALDYVPNSLAERLLATYAKQGQIPIDPETSELLELTIAESTAMVERVKDPELASFFRESAALLEAIRTEVGA